MPAVLARVLAIPRNIDVMPPSGMPLFYSLAGTVPNDGAWHALTAPAAAPPLIVDPRWRIRVKHVRAEWQTLDLTVPPPLTLRVRVDGQSTIAVNTLASLPLLAIAQGTPAIEAPIYADLDPGVHVTAEVRNTGAVAQILAVMFTGYAYPAWLQDGDGYSS